MVSMMEMGIVMITRLNRFPMIKLNKTFIAGIMIIVISKKKSFMKHEAFVEKMLKNFFVRDQCEL